MHHSSITRRVPDRPLPVATAVLAGDHLLDAALLLLGLPVRRFGSRRFLTTAGFDVGLRLGDDELEVEVAGADPAERVRWWVVLPSDPKVERLLLAVAEVLAHLGTQPGPGLPPLPDGVRAARLRHLLEREQRAGRLDRRSALAVAFRCWRDDPPPRSEFATSWHHQAALRFLRSSPA